MDSSYKWIIGSCDVPSKHRSESQCKSTIMNLIRQDIQRMIDREESSILAEDYKFFEWDFKECKVMVVYNPYPVSFLMKHTQD